MADNPIVNAMNTSNDVDNTNTVMAKGANVPTEVSSVGNSLPENVDNTNTVNAAATTAPTQPSTVPNTIAQPNNDVLTGPGAGVRTTAANSPMANTNLAPAAPPKHHGVFYDIMNVLAGPAFKYQVNAQTGEMEKIPVERTGKDLANSVIAGALTGLFAGVRAGGGPNAKMRAFGAGGTAVMQQKRELDTEQRAQAQQDFARKASIFDTNMRMFGNQVAAAKLGYEAQQQRVDLYKPFYDDLQKVDGAVIDAIWGEDLQKALQKYNITKDMAIPVFVDKLTDVNGKVVTNADGVEQYHTKYAIIDPSKLTSIPQEVQDYLVKQHDPQFARKNKETGQWEPIPLPNDTQLRAHQIVNAIEKASAIQMAEKQSDIFEPAQPQPTGNQPKSVPTQVTLKNADYDGYVNDAAEKYKVDPNLVKAVIKVESQENANAISPKGAQGLMQLMPNTAKGLGVSNPADPQQNIDGGVRYLSDLLKQTGGDVEKALRLYHGIGSDGITTDNQYANNVMKLMGQQPAKKSGYEEFGGWHIQKPDLKSALDNATIKYNDLTGILNKYGWEGIINGQADKMIDRDKSISPEALGKLKSMLVGEKDGNKLQGQELINAINEDKKMAFNVRQTTEEAAAKAEASNAEQMKNLDIVHQILTPPPGFKFDKTMQDMDASDLQAALSNKGVPIPDNFESLYAVGHYRGSLSQEYAGRVWAKGAPREMDAQSAKSYILKYINPDYDVKKFNAYNKIVTQAHDANSQLGRAIANAPVAAQHLDLLKKAASALNNGNMQAVNYIANALDVQIGKSAPVTFQAIADKVADEVSKVAMGGNAPYQEQIRSGREQMATNQSPQQIADVIKAWTGLMYGRLKGADDFVYGPTKEHLDNISPDVTRLFHDYGYLNTPWAPIPKGATMRVPDANGVMHWSDGKNDLGVVDE